MLVMVMGVPLSPLLVEEWREEWRGWGGGVKGVEDEWLLGFCWG